MANKDLKLITGIIEKTTELLPGFLNDAKVSTETAPAHPIDSDILKLLEKISIKQDEDDFAIFQYSTQINELWKEIIEKSIICLRFFDTREPFKENTAKRPVAYGVSDLGKYFDKYSEFETMLYGGGKYYRDHVIHVFRTWLLGLDCLLENEAKYLQLISLGGDVSITLLEKVCIWSIIALTHDLGYPLEKSQEIIDKTKEMMKSFVANPMVSMDLSFNGIQCNMNDFVLRFMSSKMIKKSEVEDATKPYVARLQPKYYFKFQKSLEKSMHGVISAIIIYKLLIYFLESDYSINEDYAFGEEDVRQFYIRREILRSISSHTCKDIYHLDMLSFSYLLIVADDCQEWGRKKISELYVKSNTKYEFGEIQPSFNIGERDLSGGRMPLHKSVVSEQFIVPENDIAGLKRILVGLYGQFETYKTIFRDGQDTVKRNFSFVKNCVIEYDGKKKIKFTVQLSVSNEKSSDFTLVVSKCGQKKINDLFGQKFVEDTFSGEQLECQIQADNEEESKYFLTGKSHA